MTLAEQLQALHRAITTGELEPARELVREDGVDPLARLRVYAHAYRARIAGVLAVDYPKLRALLGAARFDALVGPYLVAHPTRHPSLREAGARVAEFLLADDPHAAGLARLERARTEAFDGPDAAVLSRDNLAALPAEDFPALRLALVPTAALVELATNADEAWDAIEGQASIEAVAAPCTGPRVVLVWRRDITVIHRTVDPDEAVALRRVAAGATFGDICEGLAGVERALELLVRWLDAEILAR